MPTDTTPPDGATTTVEPAGPAATPRSAWRSTIGAIAVDAVPPLLIFYVLRALGVSDVLAFTAGSIVPLVRLVVDRWRRRPFNVISALVAGCLLVSVVLALTTGVARAVIARGGVIYLAVALAAAVSLPTRSPLMLLLSRHVVVRSGPDAAARFDTVFGRPEGLRAMRRVTALWALAFTISAVACVACAYTLPITAAATATSLLEPVIAMVLGAVTARYLRRIVEPTRRERPRIRRVDV